MTCVHICRKITNELRITIEIPHVTTDFLQQPIDIKKLRIYQDGSIEFENGGIALPRHIAINIGPVSLAMDNICYGSHEAMYAGAKRQYSYFSFSGNIKTATGSVEARGKGVEFHFTRDNTTQLPLHTYLRIAGIGVDIKIPAKATKEDADVYIHGYLARHAAWPG